VNYTLVGAFVLALGAAMIAVVLWLASGGAFQKKYDLYHAIEDESVAGLNLNAPVKNNGVDVGKVRDIKLDAANPERVILLLAIERGTSIKEDTVAVLKTQGLTGIAYVELSGSTRDSPPLGLLAGNAYPVIRTKHSLATRLENVLTNVLAKLESTSNNLNAMLGEDNRTSLKSALADIATVARTVAARKDTLDSSLVQAEKTFRNTATASAQIAPVIDRIGRGAAAIEKMGSDFSQTSASATQAVDAVGADVSRFTANTLPELQQLLSELGALTTSLRRLSEQTERDPRGLLFGRKPVPNGPGESASKP
jgi:phospholipid/cholesterol/gamma-HCH transport system substrate-binding protein